MIEIESLKSRAVPVQVRSGVLNMRPASIAADRELLWCSRRPGWYSARGAVNRFLARCAAGASPETIGVLGERDRGRLMLAAVHARKCESDWRRLYGSPLSTDERFVAVMIWAHEREAKRLQQRLIELRQNLFRNNEDKIRKISETAASAALGTPKPLAAMSLLEDRLKPFSSTLDRHLDTSRKLERLFGQGWVNPLAKQALGIESVVAQEVLGFGLKSQLEELAFGPLGMNRGIVGAEARADFRGLLGLPSATSIVNPLQPSTHSAMSAALRSMQGVYEPPWLSAAVSSLVKTQLASYFNPRPPAFGGLDLKQLSALPGMPMFSGALQRLQIKDGLSHLLPAMGFRPADLMRGAFPSVFEELTRVSRPLVAAAEFAAAWGEDPLWFVLSVLSPRHCLLLLELQREQVYEATFHALDHAVRQSDLVDAVSGAIGEVSYLTHEQREWLIHGLEHAKAGDWVQAVPPLITGLEGALHGAALDAQVIPAGSEANYMAAEKLIKRIEFGEEFRAFAIRLAFGGRGQAFRHGRPKDASRDQALLLVVAVIGWLDYTLGSQGTYLLAREMREPLGIAARSYEAESVM